MCFQWNIRRRKHNRCFFQVCWQRFISSSGGFKKCWNSCERETVVVKPQDWVWPQSCARPDTKPKIWVYFGAGSHHVISKNAAGLLKADCSDILQYFSNLIFRGKKKSLILRCGLFPQGEFGLGFCRFYWNAFSVPETSTVIQKAPQSTSETVTWSPKGTNIHLLLLQSPGDEMFALKADAEEAKSWALARAYLGKKNKYLELCQGLDFKQDKEFSGRKEKVSKEIFKA